MKVPHWVERQRGGKKRQMNLHLYFVTHFACFHEHDTSAISPYPASQNISPTHEIISAYSFCAAFILNYNIPPPPNDGSKLNIFLYLWYDNFVVMMAEKKRANVFARWAKFRINNKFIRWLLHAARKSGCFLSCFWISRSVEIHKLFISPHKLQLSTWEASCKICCCSSPQLATVQW